MEITEKQIQQECLIYVFKNFAVKNTESQIAVNSFLTGARMVLEKIGITASCDRDCPEAEYGNCYHKNDCCKIYASNQKPLPNTEELRNDFKTKFNNYSFMATNEIFDWFMAELSPVIEEKKWISVEQPPTKSGRYIVYDSNLFGNPENTVETLRYDAVVNGWFELSDRYHPQFWMPLPSPPKDINP